MVSILLPSMFRPDALLRTIEVLRQTTKPVEIEIVVAIDEDLESAERAESIVDKITFCETRQGVVAAYNRASLLATGDMCFSAPDDMECEAGWLEKAVQMHKERLNGYGLVGLSDGEHRADTAVFHLVDRRFIIEQLHGCCAPPCYRHYYSDTETTQRAIRAKRYYWHEASGVRHNHVSDAVYFADTEYAGRDEKLYWERHHAGFPNNYGPVLKG